MEETMGRNRLKILRLKHGLSQKELADLVDMKQPMINRIENQTSQLTIVNAMKIANVLEEPFSELFEELKEMDDKRTYDFLGMLQDWQLMELKNEIEKELKMREMKREEV